MIYVTVWARSQNGKWVAIDTVILEAVEDRLHELKTGIYAHHELRFFAVGVTPEQ